MTALVFSELDPTGTPRASVFSPPEEGRKNDRTREVSDQRDEKCPGSSLTGSACLAEGCSKPVQGRGLCAAHYRRARGLHPGTLDGFAAAQESGRWVGDELAGYGCAHVRVLHARGFASLYACTMPGCHSQAAEWALRPDAAHARRDDTGTWSPDPWDYTPMCAACHRQMDAATRAARTSHATRIPAPWTWPTAPAFTPVRRWQAAQAPLPAPAPPTGQTPPMLDLGELS